MAVGRGSILGLEVADEGEKLALLDAVEGGDAVEFAPGFDADEGRLVGGDVAVGMQDRILDLLSELPVPPMALKEINKLIPKRVRRKKDDQ